MMRKRMVIIMIITKVETMHSKPVLVTRQQISDEFDMCLRTVDTRIKELSEYSARYGEYTIIKHGSMVLVNKLALVDFLAYRDRLKDKNLRKNVPPYNPENVAKQMGYYNIIESSADADFITKELNDAIEQKSREMFKTIANALGNMA